MNIVTKARADPLQSSDMMISVEPADELIVEIESKVNTQFEHLLRVQLVTVLEKPGMCARRMSVSDRGALDYAIQARLETALQRAGGL